jgi:hypothetical protein
LGSNEVTTERRGLVKKTLVRLAVTTMAAGAVALGGAIAVAAPAAAAQTAPVTIQAWQIYAVYATHATCEEVGKALLRANHIEGWKCEFDSPGYALYVRY